MAVTYLAAKSNTSESRRVLGMGGSSSEGVVIKSDDSIPTSSVIAVTVSYEAAQEIANSLNGGA